MIADGKMDIVELCPTDIYVLLDDMEKNIARINAKRIVVDSLSIISVYCGSYKNLPEDMIEYIEKTTHTAPIAMGSSVKKQMLYTVMKKIRQFGCTTILTSELSKSSKWFSRDKISEFACDGVILLDYHVLGASGMTRTITVMKIRRAKYCEGVNEFKITEKGILII
jgi:hypothetical protein